jgi:pyroglutamyl-peptidase
VIHIGLAVDRNFFAIERGAGRDSYHQYPDVARKLFNKAENKKTGGKSPERLNSPLDLDATLVKWQAQAGKGLDLRMSDDVGTYVCGFVYYTSLECFWKKGEEGEGEMPVVFMHAPSLPEKDDVEKGTKVNIALIKGIAESIGK